MIIELRFGINQKEGEEKTQKEVADLLGISQSYISRLEKEDHQTAEKRDDQDGLCINLQRKFKKMFTFCRFYPCYNEFNKTMRQQQ